MYKYSSFIENSKCKKNVREILHSRQMLDGNKNIKSKYIYVQNGIIYGIDYITKDILTEYNFVDCHNNEDIFLSIVSIQNFTDDNQYYVFDEDYKNYKKGDLLFVDIANNFENELMFTHKAKAEEIISYFMK